MKNESIQVSESASNEGINHLNEVIIDYGIVAELLSIVLNLKTDPNYTKDCAASDIVKLVKYYDLINVNIDIEKITV